LLMMPKGSTGSSGSRTPSWICSPISSHWLISGRRVSLN